MPCYEYKCVKCKNEETKLVECEKSEIQKCSECNEKLEKMISSGTSFRMRPIKD